MRALQREREAERQISGDRTFRVMTGYGALFAGTRAADEVLRSLV